ncbi:PH domain-containing protein [Hydrocarboniclastica marina]|uniref:Bacterial Pleckstrin homology domain-containing protein n=1 Tax=Hydrocarboniclastica marina TaxID=2259620 RepID=A0A4V1D8X4_9ALTE|nr:PH domain-containing protein [Hydrocarboniclastica marina]QCF26700.1 hypothetical protein soil367_12575 [Hydrocarboniclastica marina]
MPKTENLFAAPWDRTLRLVTVLISLVCLTLTAFLWPVIQAHGPASMHFWGGLLPVFIVVAAALFAVRGYRVEKGELVIERLLWNTRFDLSHLQSVQSDPMLMQQARSVLGNSGFFGFMGLFKHPARGPFRAWVTDPGQALVLQFGDLVVAISPEDGSRFVAALQQCNPRVRSQ